MMSLLRGLGAILAGIFVVVVPSIGTDLLLMAIGLLPTPGKPAGDGMLLLATVYRTIYGALGSYVAARLAPSRPLSHAMVLGVIGLAASLAGLVATWDQEAIYGPAWYPIALVILALPQAWVGGKLGSHPPDARTGESSPFSSTSPSVPAGSIASIRSP